MKQRRALALPCALWVGLVCGCSSELASRGSFQAAVPLPSLRSSPGTELQRAAVASPAVGATRGLGQSSATSTEPRDAIVRVVSPKMACTGSLIAPELVLTAQHCVEGSLDGLSASASPRITVEFGGDHLPWAEQKVRAVVTPPCARPLVQGDIAVLVLERPLPLAPRLPVALGRAPKLGESVQTEGFGRCPLLFAPVSRKARLASAIANLTQEHFRLDAGVCPGDSGAPAVSADGRILGVLSASAMDGDPQTLGETEFVRVDRWVSVLLAAKRVARGEPAGQLDCALP